MKRTKKIMGIMMALMLVLALMLSACGGNNATTGNNQPTDSKPTGAPTTSSTSKTDPTGTLSITVTPDTIEIYAGDDYDLMFGVTVDNADATLRISDSGDFDETTPGTYTITYEAALGDVKVTATRTVIVLAAKSNIAVEVLKNILGDEKWPAGKLLSFANNQYVELNADFSTDEKLSGVFHNTSDQDIVVSINGSSGVAAIITANGVVIEGRDGANGKLMNEKNPSRASAPGSATIVVDGEDVLVAQNFAKVMTIPAGGFAIVVQTGAFGTGFDFDGRGFLCHNVIGTYGNVIRLFWVDTNEELTTYVNQKPTVSGNNKVLAQLGDASFDMEAVVKAGLVINDDNGTFDTTDDVTIEEITLVNNGGFDVNVPGLYTVTLSVTDGELTTEFTREVEVKSDGVGILQIGENKLYVNMDMVFVDQDLTGVAGVALLIYTKNYTAGINFDNGYGVAIIVNEFGAIVRVYDGVSGKYFDATTSELGIQDPEKCTPAGYLREALASLQDGETMIAAPNIGGANTYRGFLYGCRKIGLEVSGLGLTFETKKTTITIGDREFTAEEGKWLYNTEVSTKDAAKYSMIIFDKKYTGTFTTNGYGAVVVLDQYGALVKVYDGANLGFYTKDGKTAAHFDANSYATTAFADLQDGEIMIIFPNDGGANAARAFALGLRGLDGHNLFGEIATLKGFTFAEKPKDNKVLTIGDKAPFVAEEGKWLYNTPVSAADAANYQMLIFDKDYIGVVSEYAYGAAIVLDRNGVLVKIYDGANVQYWTVNGKAMMADFGQKDYAPKAFADLQDGETLIVFPHNGTNRNWALSLRNAPNGPCECGKAATLTGFTFGGVIEDDQDKDDVIGDQDKDDTTVDQDKDDTTVDQDKDDTTVDQDKDDTTVDQDKDDTTVDQDKDDTTVDQDKNDDKDDSVDQDKNDNKDDSVDQDKDSR